MGADGWKTGHTEAAGYGLVGSAKRGNRRITFLIAGLITSKERTMEAEKITNWAYRDFTAKLIVKKNKIIGHIPVWLGKISEVALYPEEDLYILAPVTINPIIKAELVYSVPMLAPFEAGAVTPAKLKVILESDTHSFNKEFNLFAYEESGAGNFFTRFKATTIIIINHIKKIIE